MAGMTGFSVDPTSIYDYAGQFIDAGAAWAGSGTSGGVPGPGIAALVQQCDLPALAFGGDGVPVTRLVSGVWGGYLWGAAAQPALYASYHSLWQFLSGVANTAQTNLQGWSNALIVVANRYVEAQNTQTTSMSAEQQRLMNLNQY